MTDRDPLAGYIGVGFSIDPSGGSAIEERLMLAIEPDAFEVDYHDEVAEPVVTVRFEDPGRNAGGDLVMAASRADELVENLTATLEEARDDD